MKGHRRPPTFDCVLTICGAFDPVAASVRAGDWPQTLGFLKRAWRVMTESGSIPERAHEVEASYGRELCLANLEYRDAFISISRDNPGGSVVCLWLRS